MSHDRQGSSFGCHFSGRFRAFALALVVASSILCPKAFQGQNSAFAKPAADLPPGEMQAKATTACTGCHEARIILQQRLSKTAWTKEVDKMTKWGALVDPKDRDALIDYLSTNFGPDKPPYEPPRSATKASPAHESAP
jgi:hypothetical protein